MKVVRTKCTAITSLTTLFLCTCSTIQGGGGGVTSGLLVRLAQCRLHQNSLSLIISIYILLYAFLTSALFFSRCLHAPLGARFSVHGLI